MVYIVVAVQSLSHVWYSKNPMDWSPRGSSVHGISQARTLEWVAISFSGDLPNTSYPHWRQTLYHLRTREVRNGVDQFSSVTQSFPTLCNPTDCSTPGFPVHHQLPELAQIHVHQVSDAIQPSHPLSCYSSCPQSFPASGSFPVSQFFTSGGQSIGVSTSA